MRFVVTSLLCFFACLSIGVVFAQPTPLPALLVDEKSGAQLATVDPSTLEIVAQVPANDQPHEVATDGEYAYVSNARALAITIIDLQTLTGEITGLNNPDGMA